jgi:two-component system, NarL family, sensor histidine kinase DesK
MTSVDTGSRRLEYAARIAQFAFLLFLVFGVRDLFAGGYSTQHETIVLVGLVAFVAVYLALMSHTAPVTRRTVVGFGVLLALALALAFDNTAEWAMLLIYVSGCVGFRLPPRYAIPGIVACAALAAAIGFTLPGYETSSSVQYVIYAVAIGFLLLGFATLVVTVDELRQARHEVARLAVIEERLRFARDLHDLLGHSLSVIALKSELARRLLPEQPERAAVEVAELEQVTRGALAEVREAVSGYRRMTLTTELEGARLALDAAGIETNVERAEVTLDPDAEAVLAWAVREATTNVIRHSRARRCTIRVGAGLRGADLEVVDDGEQAAAPSAGSGLAGLEERVRVRAGRVEAGPLAGGGFRLYVSVPLGP